MWCNRWSVFLEKTACGDGYCRFEVLSESHYQTFCCREKKSLRESLPADIYGNATSVHSDELKIQNSCFFLIVWVGYR